MKSLRALLLLLDPSTQEPATRPALEATETLLLDGTLAVRLPSAVERPRMGPLIELLMTPRKQPGVTLLTRPIADGGLALRAVQLPWRASADFGRDVAGEVATWERLDPLRRRFRVEPLKLAEGVAFLVVPDALVQSEASLFPQKSLPVTDAPANAIAFLKRSDGLVQEVAFCHAAAAPDGTALSRAVAASLRMGHERLATTPRRVEVFPGIFHLDLPDGWISSVCIEPPGSVRILVRKVVPFGQPAPTLAMQGLCDVDAVFLTGLPAAMAREAATELIDSLTWPPTAGSLLRLASGVAGLRAALATLPAMGEALIQPFLEYPLAGEARPAGLRLQRRWSRSWFPTPGDLRIVGVWYGAPDPGSLAEVEALASQVRATARAR